jgi:hypothetical protein
MQYQVLEVWESGPRVFRKGKIIINVQEKVVFM